MTISLSTAVIITVLAFGFGFWLSSKLEKKLVKITIDKLSKRTNDLTIENFKVKEGNTHLIKLVQQTIVELTKALDTNRQLLIDNAIMANVLALNNITIFTVNDKENDQRIDSSIN